MTKAKAAVQQGEDNKTKKPRLKKSSGSNATELEKTIIGQEVHGIVDGSFDAGYLLTVKVGNSPLVFRGLVFEPGMLAPLSKNNDIAPTIRSTARDPHVNLPPSVETPGQGPSHTKLKQADEVPSNWARILGTEQAIAKPSYPPEDVKAVTLKEETDRLSEPEARVADKTHLDHQVNDLPSTQYSSKSSDIEVPDSVVQRAANSQNLPSYITGS